MPSLRWRLPFAAIAALMTVAGAAGAQITTGTITGRVVDGSGKPVDAAQILVENKGTGFRRGTLTNVNGSYTVFGLEVGTGYSVTAKRIGFAAITKDEQGVSVGTTTRVDFDLRTQVAQLSGVAIVAVTDPIISPSRMGVGTTITDSSLHRLPSLNRSSPT